MACDDPPVRHHKGNGGPEGEKCLPQASPEQTSEAVDGNLGLQALTLKHTISMESIHSFFLLYYLLHVTGTALGVGKQLALPALQPLLVY